MNQSKKVNLLFMFLILFYITVIICLSVIKGTLNINYNTSLLLVLSQALVLLPVSLYFIISRTNPFRLIRFKRLKVGTIFQIILFTILIGPLITFINAVSMLFTTNAVSEISQEMIKNSVLLNLLLMAILPAVNEEFVFRGVFYHTYRQYNAVTGAILSGVLFGIMHLNMNQFSYALVLGIIFALLVEATGSIYSSMLAHFVVNASSVILLALFSFLNRYLQSNPQIRQEFEKAYGQSFDMNLFLSAASASSPKSLLPVILLYGIIAVITTTLSIGVFMWICHSNHSTDRVKELFFRGSKGKMDQNGEKMERSVVSIPLIIGVLIGILYMIAAGLLG